MRRASRTLVLTLAISCLGIAATWACPFCSSVSQTLTEEINSMQVVAVAKLVEAPLIPKDDSIDPNGALPKAKFRIQDVIKGSEFTSVGDEIEVLYFGEANEQRPYLVMGTDAPRIVWSTPLGLSERAYEYVSKLSELPADHQRLEFFQEYLEDADEILARDAYDEFAKAPYEDVITLKDKLHRDRLIKWVQDPTVPASRKRLYFTMLGVCGQREDSELLRSMMRSDDRQMKAGLDALLACYLILSPDQGLDEVDDLFLKNKDAEYADTYAAIMAIRFHGNQTDKIAKERLIKSLRHLLERPELADLVIPDLARWQDWDVMPRMVQLFKEADEKSSWVRVPVVNFLRSCPLPEAKEAMEELSKIDPEAVRRAKTFFPFDAEGDAGDASKAQPDTKKSSSRLRVAPSDVTNVASDARATRPALARTADAAAPARRLSQVDASAVRSTADQWSPNRWALLGVPLVAGIALMFVLRFVLGYPQTGRAEA